MFSRPLSCPLTVVVVVVVVAHPRPRHRRRERRCARCSPLPQERFPFIRPSSPSLRALLASCPPFSVLPFSSLCRRCARCSPLPQERFPFFRPLSPPLRALLASCSSQASLLPHPLDTDIVGVVPAAVSPPVLFPSPLSPLQRSSAVCSLPEHALSHPSVIFASAAIHVTTGVFLPLHKRHSTSPSLC